MSENIANEEEVVVDDPMTKISTIWRNNISGNHVYVRNVLESSKVDGYPIVVITRDGIAFSHMDYAEFAESHTDVTAELRAVEVQHTTAIEYSGPETGLAEMVQWLSSEAMQITKLDVVPFALVDASASIQATELTEDLNACVGYWHTATAGVGSSAKDPNTPLPVLTLYGVVFLDRMGIDEDADLNNYVPHIRQVEPEACLRGSLTVRIDMKKYVAPQAESANEDMEA